MRKRTHTFAYHSVLAPVIECFIEEKRACGYKFVTERVALCKLDRFLVEQGLATLELPKPLVDTWIAKRPHESPNTQRCRIGLTRRFAEFMVRQGHPAHIPTARCAPKASSSFVPRILTYEEIQQLLAAADRLPSDWRSPRRHLLMPVLFRVLYGCGLRLTEATQLRVGDVDLNAGVLTIRQGKFHKDRLVPFACSLSQRLHRYAQVIGHRDARAVFFPAPDNGPYHPRTIYHTFRQLLWTCRIHHRGRGRGPRVHDIRHSFACHRLERWYREGADLNAKLPVLATYLGHKSVAATQRYLQLTAALLPELSDRLEKRFGHVIPRSETS